MVKKDREIDIRFQWMHNKAGKCAPMYCLYVALLFIISYGKWLAFAYLRKSGARTIMCWKSSSDRRPSLSRSASSITFSHTILTSSSVSSLRVSLFNVFSRSDLQMKSSLLKSCKKIGEKEISPGEMIDQFKKSGIYLNNRFSFQVIFQAEMYTIHCFLLLECECWLIKCLCVCVMWLDKTRYWNLGNCDGYFSLFSYILWSK